MGLRRSRRDRSADGRRRRPRALAALTLVVVGHSLGAHVALASQGAKLIAADALIVAAGNVWMRHLEPSRRLWAMKLATISMARSRDARGTSRCGLSASGATRGCAVRLRPDTLREDGAVDEHRGDRLRRRAPRSIGADPRAHQRRGPALLPHRVCAANDGQRAVRHTT